MYFVKTMRGRTRSLLYGAFSVFIVTFVLNVMVLRTNIVDSQNILHSEHQPRSVDGLDKEEAYANFVAQGQRKPKAAYESELLKELRQNVKEAKVENSENTHIKKSFQGGASDSLGINLNDIFENPKVVHKNKEEIDYDEDDLDDDTDYKDSEEQQPTNKLFEPGDFVNASKIIFERPLLKYQDVPNQEQEMEKMDVNEKVIRQNFQTVTGDQMVTNGNYWSDVAEMAVPKGFDQNEAFTFVKKSQSSSIKSIQPPSWNKCGRPKNAFLVLDDGSSFCARYRDPHNKLVLGEVMSFYLSRLLGMDSVPAVVLAVTNQTSPRWKAVDVSSVQWQDGKVVALIQWTPNMESVRSLVSIPKILLSAYESKTVIDSRFLHNLTLTLNEVAELVQWSAMIVFDYITGHYDRFASMQDGADQEKRPGVLSEKVRNLLKSSKTNKLWFIDNESGLFDAYDLLYNTAGNSFIKYHKLMLQTTCVFQKSLVNSIYHLHASENPHLVLEGFAARHEPLLEFFQKDYVYSIFKEKFKDRISEVYNWIKHCKLKER